MAVIYVEKGFGAPLGDHDLVIGDVVICDSGTFRGCRFRIIGFSDDGDEMNSIGLLLPGKTTNYAWSLRGEEQLNMDYYNVILDKEVQSLYSDSLKCLWFDSDSLIVVEEYVENFWKV